MDERNFLARLKHPYVRDMFWILASPSPLAEHFDDTIPVFPSLWNETLTKSAKLFFLSLDEQPHKLVATIKSLKSTRLGIYAETLLRFFFEHFEGVELVLSQYQVFDDGKTLGEVDFVIEWEGRVIHIEFTTKYYLSTENTNVYSSWIGPSGNDDLEKKLFKARDFQLPLVRSSCFKEQTDLFPESYLLMKGVFFTNEENYPLWKNSKSFYPSYYRYTSFLNTIKQTNLQRYNVLSRPHWLSDTVVPLTNDEKLTKKSLEGYIQLHKSVLLFDNEQQLPLFILADDWPVF